MWFGPGVIKVCVILLLIGVVVPGRAQEIAGEAPVTARHFFKTAPLHLEEFNLAYEYLAKPNQAWQIGAGYIYKLQTNKGVVIVPRATALTGFSLRLSRRTYTRKQSSAPHGNYSGLLGTYRYQVFPVGPLYDEAGNVRTSQLFQQVGSVQYLWGMQRIFQKCLLLDAYVGVGGRVKYAYRHDPEVPENYKMRTRVFYGFAAATGPDWAILLGPSVSLNLAIGVAF